LVRWKTLSLILSASYAVPLFFSILVWKPPEGLNPSQALDLLQKRLEKLGGLSLGTWTVDCETLLSTPSLGTDISRGDNCVCGSVVEGTQLYSQT